MARRRRVQYGSAEFKARCLELVDEVKEARMEIVITRHGRPVARLGPIEPDSRALLVGCMAGTVLGYDGPFDPVPGAWDVDAEPIG